MTFLAIYVDDIIITSNDTNEINSIKTHLDKTFSIEDLGKLHYFLGIEVKYTTNGIILHQHKFTKEILSNSGFKPFKKVVTPLPVNLKLSAEIGKLLEDPTSYRSLVGKLNY